MMNDKSQYLGLPLPHDLNHLEEDIPRLRESLMLVDAALHEVQVTLDDRADNMELEVRLAVQQALEKMHVETEALITLVEEAVDAQVARMSDSLHTVRILRLNQLLNLGI